MNRRGFLTSILASGVAPYVVTTAGVLMPVRSIVRPSPVVARFVRIDSAAAAEFTVMASLDGEKWFPAEALLRTDGMMNAKELPGVAWRPEAFHGERTFDTGSKNT